MPPRVEPAKGIGVTDAAARLGVTTQTVRNWIRRGDLDARLRGRTWVIDGASLQRLATTRPRRSDRASSGPIEDRLEDLTAAVERLTASQSTSAELLEALRRERDRFRAEAAASKEAALRVNSAARDTHRAVRQLLDVLEHQADALTQLLAPGSPEDLLR
jgi:transposase